MKILVGGADTFVGIAFTDSLKRRGIPFVEFDKSAKTAFGCDAAVYFAPLTPTSSDASELSFDAFRSANVGGMESFLKALKKDKKLSRVVAIGSSAEYGLSLKPLTEGDAEKPTGPYGKSMLEASKLLKKFSREAGVKTFNLRLFNEVGLPKRAKAKDVLAAWPTIFESFFYQFVKDFKGTITLRNRASVRDFVDIDDVVEAIFAALESTAGKGYELINISSGKGTKLSDLARIFGKAVGKDFSLVSESSDKSDVSVGNPAKAHRLLGWKPKTTLQESVRKMIGAGARVLVIGAGEGAQKIAKQIKKEHRWDIIIDGFVDDDPAKQGMKIDGAEVMGTIADLPDIVRTRGIEQVLVSTPSVGGEFMKRVTSLVPSGVPIKVLPSISSVILGNVDLSVIRNIELSDIIGRPLVKADQQFISKKAAGKTFLVTGGAGSIGSEIVRQIYDSDAAMVIVVDAWEEGVFNIVEELSAREAASPQRRLKTYIGNVRDRERMDEILGKHKVDVILHAAAYKHVPLMEENPSESHKTNHIGTMNMLDLALKYCVKDFVLISTDKAVNPISVMGKSKREAELLVKEYARRHPEYRFSAVRFGNVLNSSGSIVPKFIRQIRSRSPVTITHMGMTRYFMSIPEAVSLVLLSWIVSENGQILILDMGEPVKIIDLAISLIRFHGLEPHKDIPIKEIGTRPGEKIHEELAYDKSRLRQSPAKRVFIAEEL